MIQKKRNTYKYVNPWFNTLCCVLLLFPFISNSQNIVTDSSEQNTSKINFGWTKRHPSKSLKPYFEALKKTEYGIQRFSIYDQLIAYHTKKNTVDSILHYSNLYLKEIGNWDETEHVKQRYFSKAYYYLGSGSYLNGLLENAIKWHIKGIQDAEISKHTEYNYKNKIGLAKCYIQQLKTDKALDILQTNAKRHHSEYPFLKIKNKLLLGKAYRFKKKYDKAATYYKEALHIADSLNDLEMQYTTRLEQAKLAEAKNEVDKATQGYETTRNDAKRNGFDAIYYEGSLLLTKHFYNQEYYDHAIMGLSIAYINAIDSENLQFQKEILNLQYKSFAKKEDYKNAYAVITQLLGVQKKISNNQQREIIKELEIQYETLEKEKEISTLEENQIIKEGELKTQKAIKNAILIGFLVILIPVIGLLYMYYQKLQAQSELAKKQEEINQQKVTSLKQEQELNLIKASVAGQDEERRRIAQELHDSIGGNLAGIKLQISSLDSTNKELKNVSQQLDETYQLVRDISHTLVPKKYRENNFTSLLEEYATNINKTGRLKVDFYPHDTEQLNSISDTIQMELFKIIQELMTNTLKHANAKKVDIQLNYIKNEISLMFEDDGVGFDNSKASNGIGFNNIKNRIANLKGNIHIDSHINRGTIIAIEIPSLKNNNYEV